MDVSFTERELDVMGVLWEVGTATVAEVQQRLSDELAYTTVLTVLRTLEEKGHVGHREEGRAYRYFPKVGRSAAGASALRRLTRKVFRGSRELLLTELVSDRRLTEEELRRMRRMLDERLSDREGPAASEGELRTEPERTPGREGPAERGRPPEREKEDDS